MNNWQKQYHKRKKPPLVPYGDEFDDPRPLGVRQNEEAIAGGALIAGLIAVLLLGLVTAVTLLWIST